jgi:hypothetical protein
MSMLEGLFGLQHVFVNGVELVTRKAVNLVAGVGQISGVDDPVAGVSNITLGFPSAAAAPTTGAHLRGEIVLNSAPSGGGFIGWTCTAAGTPGTWKTWGAISA